MISNATQIIVDQGNTTTKFGFFDKSEKIHFLRVKDHEGDRITELLRDHPGCDIFVSSVRDHAQLDLFSIPARFNILSFTRNLELPVEPAYETPGTLGSDRIANAVAADELFPSENTLVVDAGTCITYTIVSGRKIIGGAISPGIHMRYQALHSFTGKLPMVRFDEQAAPVIGRNTEASVRSGVQTAIIEEIRGMIARYCSEINGLNVILTGGDGGYLGRYLKSTIFADPFITLKGLNKIYAFNYREKVF